LTEINFDYKTVITDWPRKPYFVDKFTTLTRDAISDCFSSRLLNKLKCTVPGERDIHLYSPSNGSMKEKNIHTYKINNKQIRKQN